MLQASRWSRLSIQRRLEIHFERARVPTHASEKRVISIDWIDGIEKGTTRNSLLGCNQPPRWFTRRVFLFFPSTGGSHRSMHRDFFPAGNKSRCFRGISERGRRVVRFGAKVKHTRTKETLKGFIASAKQVKHFDTALITPRRGWRVSYSPGKVLGSSERIVYVSAIAD